MSELAKKRSCGDCSACCTTHSVKRLKEPFAPCHNLGSEGGCAVYASRPSACRTFRCGWLSGYIGTDNQRPDMTGLVPSRILVPPVPGERITLVELYPGASETEQAQQLILESKSKGYEVKIFAFDSPIPERPNIYDLLD